MILSLLILLICLFVLAALLVALFAAGWYFSNQVICIPTQPFQDTYRSEVACGKIQEDEYNRLAKEEVTIKSPFGYDLSGTYLPLKGSRKTVILPHGVTFSRYGSVKYMWMFIRRGYNVLIYDHRDHGKSGGKYKTFGFYEKHDLKACIDWVKQRCGEDCVVGVMGESYGSAIALQTAAFDQRMSFLIVDCSFSDLPDLLTYHLRHDFHLPAFPLLDVARLITKLRAGFFYEDVSPIRDVDKIEAPIFFTHGQDDDFTPSRMSVALYTRKTKGARKLYLAPHAKHAEAYWNNRDEYERSVEQFLDEIGM